MKKPAQFDHSDWSSPASDFWHNQ